MEHKTKTKALSWLLSLALLLSLVPGLSLPAQAAGEYTLWVGGTQVTDSNLSGTGWSYDATTSTLTLNNYSYEGAGTTYSIEGDSATFSAAIYAKQDLNIQLIGTNSVKNTSAKATGTSDKHYGIHVISGKLSISGTGTLTATGECSGVAAGYDANGSITISSGTVTATATGFGDGAIYARGDITISDGTVTASGIKGINADGKVNINGGEVHATNNSVGIQSYGDITISDGTVEATGNNINGISASSGNVIITGGTVTATATDNYSSGIIASRDITISGGTVTATGGTAENTNKSCGIKVSIEHTLTISGGTVTASGGAYGIRDVDDDATGMGVANANITGGTLTASGGTQGICIHGTITVGSDRVVMAGDAAPGTDVTGTFATTHDQKWVQVRSGHTHEFTYTLGEDGKTINATCSADGCTLDDGNGNHTATLTIAAPEESGTGGAAKITDAAGIQGTAKVKYEARTADGWSTASETEPSANGVFRASITLGTATASVTYGVSAITKGTVTGENCDFTVPRVATVGVKVNPALTIAPGYEVKKITVKSGSTDVSTTVGADKEGFTMPDYNVTLDIEFGKKDYTITTSGMTYGSVTAKKGDTEVTTAQVGDTVTLVATPDTGFELTSIAVKYGENSDISLSGTGNTRTFTMPASNVTVSAVFEGAPFGIMISDAITGGTVTATQNDASVTQARAGSEVTLTATPAAGYQLGSFTVTKQGGGTVTVTDNKFTMPAEAVTVTATFVGREVSVALTEAGKAGTTCKAALLTETFAPVETGFKSKAGEKFVLRVSTDDEYDYSITFAPSNTVSTYLQEFSTEQYQQYAAYAEEHNISVPLSTDLFWVTMPGVAGDTLNITVTFSKVKTFTVLYRPDINTTAVWCKFTKTTSGTETPFAVDMMPDAIMGNQSVWTVKVTAAFAPAQVAFVTTKEALETAELTNITARQEIPTEDGHWTSVTGGKAVVIGGTAKTVMALFVTNPKALADYESLTATYNKGNKGEGSGITFKVAVCQTDNNGVVTGAGSVTVPAAPTAPEGKQFAGWRVLEGEAGNKTEDLYGVSDKNTISIKENTILNVVWKTATPTVTLNLNGGTGIENPTFNVTYNDNLPTLATPTRDGVAFDGWVVSEDVTENGEFFAKGSAFDLDTPITADLKLTARWKHVHYYTCFQIGEFGDAMAEYQSYADTHHVAVCGCMDVALKAHSFDSNGKCACGYEKPQPTEFTLAVSYQKWVSGKCEQTINEMPTTKKRNQVVSVYAPDIYGDLYTFSKWQYNTGEGDNWRDLTADSLATFKIPCNTKLRAIYTNPTTVPQVELSARRYLDYAEGYNWDNVAFHMNYKLPDGYSIVDAGVRLGDNAGISYYELKEQKRTAGEKAASAGINFGIGMLSLDLGGALVGAVEGSTSLESNFYYEKRENSVLDEMTAEKLSDYMFQRKPVNVEKYPPIYWQSQSVTEGQSASVDVIAPLSFIQKNNGKHWIYGIAWLRYKEPNGTTKVIYTPALATTRDIIPTNTVTKKGSAPQN